MTFEYRMHTQEVETQVTNGDYYLSIQNAEASCERIKVTNREEAKIFCEPGEGCAIF